MTNTENDLSNLNPTDDDLLALPVEDEDTTLVVEDDEDDDFLNINDIPDERYGEGRNGMPSWSLFA